MKRLAVFLVFALVVLFGVVSSAEEITVSMPGMTVTTSAADIDADNSAEAFIHSLFYPSKPSSPLRQAPAQTAGSKLTGAERTIYNGMAAEIPLIASGDQANTVFSFPAEDIYDKLSYTKDDLGVSSILIDGQFNPEAVEAVSAIIQSIDASGAVRALLVDMPYDLYWFDKTAGWSTGYPRLSGSNTEIRITGEVTVSLSVSEEYGTDEEYTVDTSKGQAAVQAAQNAQAIVAEYQGQSDLAQLTGFKEEICSLVSYNHDAANNASTPYGNPWQLVWVFDGDENTTVVCEGYSKAFKYLVDQSSCSATSILVSGLMDGGTGAGRHMWNIVKLDNIQYLVDVTNCDEGTVGYPDELFMVSDAEGTADTNYTAAGVTYTYSEDTISLYGYKALTLGSVAPEFTMTLSTNEALYNEDVSLTIEAEGATDARYIRSFYGGSPITLEFDEDEKVAEGIWVRDSVGSDRDYVFQAQVSYDDGETWFDSEPQELTVTVLGSASMTATPVKEEVQKGEPIVIQLTTEHVAEIWPGAAVTTEDGDYPVPEELFQVTENQVILPTQTLPVGTCSIMISTRPENGYYETGAELSIAILPVAEPSVSLTISPNTDLLTYQFVTYTVTASGATDASVVFVTDGFENEIKLKDYHVQPDDNGNWVLRWSGIDVGDVDVYAKASFDGGETWISSETQTIYFEMLGYASFKATPDAEIFATGDPVVIRFSELNKVRDISRPEISVLVNDSWEDYTGSASSQVDMDELTCTIAGLEAGSYRLVFWSAPAEDGYVESSAVVNVEVGDKAAAPTITAYVFTSQGEEVLPEGGTAWYGCNISWDLDAEGADQFEWTANGYSTYSVDSTFDPNNNHRPGEDGLIIPIEEYSTGHARVFLSAGPWQDVGDYTFKARVRSGSTVWSDWTEMHFELKCKGTLAAPTFTVNNNEEIHLGDDLVAVVDPVEFAEQYSVTFFDEEHTFFEEFEGSGQAGTYTLSGSKVPGTGEYTVYVQVYTDGYEWNYAEQTITVLEAVTPEPGSVEINETNFPDAAFRGMVSSEFDDDEDGFLSQEERDGVTQIACPEFAGIKKLTGIQYFPNVTYLKCAYNDLASLDISANTKLEFLYVYGNKLTSLDVSHNPLLKDLSCAENQLTSLDVTNNTELDFLYCSQNAIGTLDLSQNTKLTEIISEMCSLTSLDVHDHAQLVFLSVGANYNLSSLNVRGCTALKKLYCYYTGLEELDVRDSTVLSNLVRNTSRTTNEWGDIDHWESGEDYLSVNPGTRVIYGNGAGDVDPAPHVHDLTALERVEATCTEAGTEACWYCAGCGKYFSDAEAENEIEAPVVIPAKGHIEVPDDAVPATCTETGLTAGSHCSVCNAVLVAQEVIPMLEHQVVIDEPAVAPTCTETGLTAASHCSVCNEILSVQEIVPALGHAYKASFAWEGTTACVVTLTCERDASHTAAPEVTITSEVTTAAGDTTPGVRTYTATAVYKGQTYSDTKTEEIPPLMTIENGVLISYSGTATSITIPSTVTTIGASAFAGMTQITSVTIPASVTSIGANAFAGTGITEVDLGETVTSIGSGAFNPGTVIDTPASSPAASWAAANGCTVNDTTPVTPPPAEPEPTMPSSFTDNAGSYSIGSDGTATFTKPNSAATVTIPATITVNGKELKVTAIADNAFKSDKKLTTVTIGKNVRTIGKNAFASCAKLKTVKGGAAVVTIKDGAFSGCKALKTFPTLNKLQKIGANAFKGDKAMDKFTLAKSVDSIGKNAFNGCAGLKTITVKAEGLTTKNVGSGAFKGISKKATFKCPKKLRKDYEKLFVKKGAPKTCKFK